MNPAPDLTYTFFRQELPPSYQPQHLRSTSATIRRTSPPPPRSFHDISRHLLFTSGVKSHKIYPLKSLYAVEQNHNTMHTLTIHPTTPPSSIPKHPLTNSTHLHTSQPASAKATPQESHVYTKRTYNLHLMLNRRAHRSKQVYTTLYSPPTPK